MDDKNILPSKETIRRFRADTTKKDLGKITEDTARSLKYLIDTFAEQKKQ